MPKPRGNNNKWAANDLTSKRVSFKQPRGGRGGDNGAKLNVIKNFNSFDEADIGIGLPSRGNPVIHRRKFNRGGRNRSGSPAPQKKLFNSPLNWYRVYMPFGGKYDKSMVLNKLLESVHPMPLIPYMWTLDGRSALFYVEDYRVADKLHNLNKEIEMPDGFKLVIRVQSDTPNIDVNDELREKMKLAMAKRFNPVTKALDLTKFHADPSLQETFCPLFKPVVSLAAVNIIAENIPELVALNLNDNNIQMVSHLKDLPKKMPNLKTLHLANNKFKSINHLDTFTGLPIVELMLDGNQLCDNYKDQATYISEIRKRFPHLLVLDGVSLPPPISFDVEEVPIPAFQPTFLCTDAGESMVRPFLAQFFEILDSDNRQPLLQAYHENALMSYTMAYAYNQNPRNTASLSWYATDNRNLERLTDHERRRKLLKQGQLAVVAFHQEMPPTKHDLNSFTVDLTMFTPQMICFSVSGLFKETRTGKKNSPVRHFFRTFVIVPSGSGFCIMNESLHITNATEEQMKSAFKTAVVAPSTSSVLDDTVPGPSGMTKKQMIEWLTKGTNMNAEWSQRCLEETSWDNERALFAFLEASKQGLIPPEAFIQQ